MSACNVHEVAAPDYFRLSGWQVDVRAREISHGDQVRRLSPRAIAALKFLVVANGDVRTRTELLDAIWPDVTVGEESLTTAISELRRAFTSAPGDTDIIETVPRTGYRLRTKVQIDQPVPQSVVERGDQYLEAYLLVMEARKHRESGVRGMADMAVEQCREALKMAPDFALAHAQHAVSVSFKHLYDGGHSAFLKTVAMAERAVKLRPDLPFCHAALGYALYAHGRNGEARDAIARALELDANDADTHGIARCALFGMGDWRAAATLAERSAAIQPDDFFSTAIAARAAEALGDCRRAAALSLRGRNRAAEQLNIDPYEARARLVHATLSAMLGYDSDAALSLNIVGEVDAAFGYYSVLANARLNDTQKALDDLENIVDDGWRHHAFLMIEPLLDPLRGEPRFNRIVNALPH